jgi:cell division protein FtsQ
VAISIFTSKKKKTRAEAMQRRARKSAQGGKFLAGAVVLLRLLVPVLLGGCACYYIVTADFLAIRTIRITGCELIDCEKIAERAGIVPGRNIFFADVARTMRLLEDDPWIDRAIVKRILPDTIEIRVEERKAVAVLELDTACLVDTYGTVFYCNGQHENNLPVITGLTREYVMAKGERAAVLLDDALELISGLKQNNMVKPDGATRIRIEPSVGLTVDDNGTQIFMGRDKFKEKLKLLAFVQGDLALKGLSARSIHLGSDRQAAVSLNGPEPARQQVKSNKKTG